MPINQVFWPELSTTQIYSQVSIQKLKQVHAATPPAKLERKLSNDGENG